MDCKLCSAHIKGRQRFNIIITINNQKKKKKRILNEKISVTKPLLYRSLQKLLNRYK